MGGGPVAPHLKDCPAGGYEVYQYRTILSPRLTSNKTHDWTMCSEICAHLRVGTEDMTAGKLFTKSSIVSDNHTNNHSWMQAMANNYRLELTTLPKTTLFHNNQFQNENGIRRSSTRRDEQLDIGSTNVDMSGDHYSWVQAMEIYNSSEQPNQSMCEGFRYGEF